MLSLVRLEAAVSRNLFQEAERVLTLMQDFKTASQSDLSQT